MQAYVYTHIFKNICIHIYTYIGIHIRQHDSYVFVTWLIRVIYFQNTKGAPSQMFNLSHYLSYLSYDVFYQYMVGSLK